MAKSFVSSATRIAALDAFLTVIKNAAEEVNVCSTEPTTFTEANATYCLASHTITDADFTGPEAGTGVKRKITLTAQPTILIDASGTALHVALTNGVDTLLPVTTCTSQALVANGVNTVSIPAIIYNVSFGAIT
jgi:hypothetical protein